MYCMVFEKPNGAFTQSLSLAIEWSMECRVEVYTGSKVTDMIHTGHLENGEMLSDL